MTEAAIVSLTFNKFMVAAHKAKKIRPFIGTLVSLDPGETTGWAIWKSDGVTATLVEQGQSRTWPMSACVQEIGELLRYTEADHVVHETYAVYEWKTDSHAWSSIPTLRVIGCIETLCLLKAITYNDQTAQVAKNFCTDDKLKAWGFYSAGMRHARDAVRHGAYYLLFRPE